MIRPPRRTPPAAAGPVELRFLELFLLIVVALVFVFLAVRAESAGKTPDQPLEVATVVVPPAVEGEEYQLYLAADGGTGRAHWQLTGGHLPPGLTFDADTGGVSGRPGASGTSRVTVEVRDDRGATASRDLAIEVRANDRADPLHAEAAVADLGTASTYEPFRHQFTAVGGRPPHVWRLASGQPPPGFALSDDGVLAGTLLPKERVNGYAEECRFVVAVTDATGAERHQGATLWLRSAPPPGWVPWLQEVIGPVLAVVVFWVCLPLGGWSLVVLVLFRLLGFRGGWAGSWAGLRSVFRR